MIDSFPETPFGEQLRQLVEFLTGSCGMNLEAAHLCLKEFLTSKAGDSHFLQNTARNPAGVGNFLKTALVDFANHWLAKRQAEMQTASSDALGFPKTMWTIVRIAGAPESEIRLGALELLLRKYLPALKAYLTASLARRFSLSDEWIEDCLQSFISEQVLQRELVRKVERERGRFRDLLKRAIYNFAISLLRREQPWRFEALEDSQSAHAEVIAPNDEQLVDADVEWARRIMVDALRRMSNQCARKNQQVTWSVFERRRLLPLLQDCKPESLEKTTRYILDTLKVELPLKKVSEQQILGDKKFRRFIDDVLSEYCRDAVEIEEERQRLMDVLQHDLSCGGGPQVENELEGLLKNLWQALPATNRGRGGS